MLNVLETLVDRRIWRSSILREVFDLTYADFAPAVGKSPAAVRQIAQRARAPRGRAAVGRCSEAAVSRAGR